MNSVSKCDIAQIVASYLLEIGAVHVNTKQPFTLTSGAVSPVYIDCRKLIFFPDIRSKLMDFAVDVVFESVGKDAFDSVAGGETAGIPFAAFFAERTELPMQYVRKKPKGFGQNAQIEGGITVGDRVLLVEDLATDGKSKLAFVDVLRNAGAMCNHSFIIFYYDIFENAKTELQEAEITLHYLATWWDILNQIKLDDRFNDEDYSIVEAFLNNPKGWSSDHGREKTQNSYYVNGLTSSFSSLHDSIAMYNQSYVISNTSEDFKFLSSSTTDNQSYIFQGTNVTSHQYDKFFIRNYDNDIINQE